MTAIEPSLTELAAGSGVEPRTIRSWVAQGLLPAPLSRGPTARYPMDTMERVLAIRAMRELLGMPLTEIRKELLVAAPEQIRAYAQRARGLEPTASEASPAPSSQASSALDYITALRAKAVAPTPASENEAATPVSLVPSQGFGALEHRLGQGFTEPTRKARAEDWFRIPITPDIELNVRAPLDTEQRVRLERCADLIRNILLGRDR